MLMLFGRKFMDKCPQLWDYLTSTWTNNIINWFIDSKYRTSRTLTTWLKDQDDISIYDVALTIETKTSYDEQVIECLRWIRSHILYEPDKKIWNMDEKWQTAKQTLDLRTGDCEDGAILLYKLCRQKGVPANRLLIIAGDVDGGGHCWLAYKPEQYPLNFIFLDWCYWADMSNLEDRNAYEIDGTKIYRSTYTSTVPDKQYLKIWFAFNESRSHSELVYKPHDIDT